MRMSRCRRAQGVLSRRRALGVRPCLARPPRRSGVGARAVDRPAARDARAPGPCSPRAASPEDVEAFLDPTVKRLMPDPDRLMDMGAAAAHRRRGDARRAGRDLRRLRRRRRDRSGAARPLPACRRPRSDHPHPGPPVRRLWPQRRGGAEPGAARARLLVAVDCGTTSHEPLEAARRLGLDVVVIDHHLADERLPSARVVNPNRLDDLSGSATSRPSGSCS